MEQGRFRVSLEIALRPARRDDLPALEWWGWFSAQRGIIRSTFDAQERGDGIFLVADSGGFPIGQAWVDLRLHSGRPAALLWAVRVIPGLRGLGIGRRLIEACEALVRERGIAAIEISAEKDDPSVRRLYERLGYRLVGEYRATQRYTDPAGRAAEMPLDQWVLEKRLAPGRPTAA